MRWRDGCQGYLQTLRDATRRGGFVRYGHDDDDELNE